LATRGKEKDFSLIFEVRRSDGDIERKTTFGHEEVHFHELGATIGLATQSVQEMKDVNVRKHD